MAPFLLVTKSSPPSGGLRKIFETVVLKWKIFKTVVPIENNRGVISAECMWEGVAA